MFIGEASVDKGTHVWKGVNKDRDAIYEQEKKLFKYQRRYV